MTGMWMEQAHVVLVTEGGVPAFGATQCYGRGAPASAGHPAPVSGGSVTGVVRNTLGDVAATDAPPIVLVHGWGGSFQTTWRQSGFTELLGHGEAPKPHDPAAYADMTTRIVDVLPDRPVDIVGFSLGAMTTLRLATRRPELFQRIVLSGIGRNVFERDPERAARIVAGVEGTGDP